MNWEAIAALGDLIGAAVVVVSVIYLALQVKQTNRHAEAAAYAEWFYSWNETIKGWTANPETTETMRLGFTRFDDLSSSRKALFQMQLGATLNLWEFAGELAARDLIARELYNHLTEFVTSLCSTPGGRAFLTSQAWGFPHGAELLQRVRAGSGHLRPWTELAPWWVVDPEPRLDSVES